jgi:predicted dehydrogenase
MRVFVNRWSDGYLDYWRNAENQYRIDVQAWIVLGAITEQYIVRKNSLRMVWHYLLRLGPRAVLGKIRSRLAERDRNKKFFAVGVGEVLEAPAGAEVQSGDQVLFFACNHPKCASRVSIDHRFVVPWIRERWYPPNGMLAFFEPLPELKMSAALDAYIGWSPFSGIDIDGQAVSEALKSMRSRLSQVLFAKVASALLPSKSSILIRERMSGIEKVVDSEPLKGVLFGLGNYAKTQILPNLHKSLRITCIHEVDPLQIGPQDRWEIALDTSPWPREEEHYDAWFIAGFHHTHAPLAVHALRQGAYAVVEKPLAVDWDQLKALEDAQKLTKQGSLFACFHKRYSRLNDWARHDLGVSPGDPVNYHCTVYEIPLPQHHWYNWPNSRSRLTSNGCHWLDHFMYLNNFAPALDSGLRRARNGDLMVFAELENGASFSMTLTEIGSERLGVRDCVELRAGNVTVRMVDSTNYEAESTSRILRRARVNPSKAYEYMYQNISHTIVTRRPGDPITSLRSTELTLILEDELAGFALIGHQTKPQIG